MEIIVFENQNWSEIPKQDNPAFDYDYENNELQKGFIIRKESCLMIVKVFEHDKCVGKDGYVVIEVPLQGDVIRRGLFWNINDANTFAEAISKN